MKNSKKCPKCQSGDIVRIPAVGAIQRANTIVLSVWTRRPINLTRYLCAACGFSEQWIEDTDGIARLKQKFGSATG